MIVYFDTSAFVPLIVEEAGSNTALRLWNEARARVSSRLILVEVAAAVAMGRRVGRLTDDEYEPVRQDAWWHATDLTLIDAFGDVIDRAAELAHVHGLRGYDAMHLATAELLRARDLVFASGDRRLLGAAHDEGMLTVDTSGRPGSPPA